MPKKNEIYSTTTFRYMESNNPLVPDSLFFYQNRKQYQVIFDELIGWTKSIKRFNNEHSEDIVLGRVIGESKIFRILKGKTTIEWIYRNIDYEDIII